MDTSWASDHPLIAFNLWGRSDWLPESFKWKFTPKYQTVASARAWIEKAKAACEWFRGLGWQNDLYPEVEAAGDFVHDAYRILDRLDVAGLAEFPQKPIRDKWTWQHQIDVLRELHSWLANTFPESAP